MTTKVQYRWFVPAFQSIKRLQNDRFWPRPKHRHQQFRTAVRGRATPFLAGTDARNNVYMTQSSQLSVQNIPDSSD
ncbi:hypothetical protein ACQZ5D_06145 [Agrobacterium sp. 22-211-1]|uniref:hypothetical protein n=1 Tax=Agrobacterium tomkonis TaxID=1183410 RepID=UPI001CD9CA03|nr:hypothetical protein [Agrobacterium tomkonis RTP8]